MKLSERMSFGKKAVILLVIGTALASAQTALRLPNWPFWLVPLTIGFWFNPILDGIERLKGAWDRSRGW